MDRRRIPPVASEPHQATMERLGPARHARGQAEDLSQPVLASRRVDLAVGEQHQPWMGTQAVDQGGERPELIDAGAGKLVGTNADQLCQEVVGLLRDRHTYDRMREAKNPFGDGHAAPRIADILSRALAPSQRAHVALPCHAVGGTP